MIVNGADTWERIWSDSGTVWQLSNSNGKAEVSYNSETGLFRVMVYARLKCGKENRTYKGIEFITELSDAKIIGEIELRRMYLEYNSIEHNLLEG